jgi:CopA family copper-resistance protein
VSLNRRQLLKNASLLGAATGLNCLLPHYAGGQAGKPPAAVRTGTDPIELAIRKHKIRIAGGAGTVVSVNGTVPGPLLRFREGQDVTINVRNGMADESTSIHWHGLLVPWNMDGVPGVSFAGIPARQTFTYRFKLRQSGTYWYHSHTGAQEQIGLYGPLIIDSVEPEPYQYDRDYVVVLSDWSFEDPLRLMDRMKNLPTYYNFQQRTAADFFRDIRKQGWRATLSDRLMWGRMRMSPTDILDVTGYTYTYLVNGLSPELNWTALFRPGERVRLRFINAGAMTIFDVRIPGLRMTVVHADGKDVETVEVDEFRMGAAETYDVIVQPAQERAYTIFAEAMDRSGFAAGTLAPREGMRGALPPRRKRPLRTMKDMGMAHAGGHAGATPPGHIGHTTPESVKSSNEHAGHQMPAPAKPSKEHSGHASPERVQQPSEHAMHSAPASPEAAPVIEPAKEPPMQHGPDHHGPGNAMIAEMPQNRRGEPGTGLEGMPWRVLVYTDLLRLKADPNFTAPQHEIELHLTGNMERNMWSINGKKYSEDPAPIPVAFGQTTRFTLVNDTMMDHPMHVHGMFLIVENGAGAKRPHKHTVLVKAGERMSFDVTPDEPGPFAFHCHLLFHMEFGMFRVVGVSGKPGEAHS